MCSLCLPSFLYTVALNHCTWSNEMTLYHFTISIRLYEHSTDYLLHRTEQKDSEGFLVLLRVCVICSRGGTATKWKEQFLVWDVIMNCSLTNESSCPAELWTNFQILMHCRRWVVRWTMTESELQQFQTVMLNINIRHSQQHLLDPVTVISGLSWGERRNS